MGTISLENGDRLFWLGRYTERVFTTLKALEKQYDRMMDEDHHLYTEYLKCFGLADTYGDMYKFMYSFLYDQENPNSAVYSLERAYDNGIVLREEISTEALGFLQMAKDTMEQAKDSNKGLLYNLLPVEDTLFGFWGCIDDYIYDEEILNIILCGKSVERLDLYFRMGYSSKLINMEFERLCKALRKFPKDSPYRYNTEQLSVLVEVVGLQEDYPQRLNEVLNALSKLFNGKKPTAMAI